MFHHTDAFYARKFVHYAQNSTQKLCLIITTNLIFLVIIFPTDSC